MDPFTYFPSEICDSILSHLTGSELLQASTVSKTWYSIIGESPRAMQKLQLNLFWLRGPRKMTYEMADILIDSTRRYQNVVIKFQSLNMNDFTSIMEQECRNWKKVQLERLTFKSAAHLINVLKICQNTVEELELDNLYIKHGMGLEALDFPKLKILKLTNNDIRSSTINDIFVNCKKLEKLEIITDDITEKCTNSMKIILKNNRNLKCLEMTSQQVNAVFNEEMSYDFKLDTFISCSYCYLPSGANYKNLVAQQFGSLKVLSVDQIACSDSMKLIFKMPKLKCLNIGNIDTTAMILSYNQLSVNKSIEELSYQDQNNDFNFMQCLTDAVPNLKKVEMYSLTQNMTEYMSSSLKELEALKLRTLDATDLASRELFGKLKNLQIDVVTSTFEEHILSIPVDDCNPLVMLLKDSSYIVLN